MRIVIPVKPFAFAKQRLARTLTEDERAELARAMLRDLLKTSLRAHGVTGVVLVGDPRQLAPFVQSPRVEVLAEEERGLSRAVAQAGAHLAGRGEISMLMLPGDVPLATVEEIETLVAGHPARPAVSIVPDREGFGTNALVLAPTTGRPFLFGRESFAAHRAAAEALGWEVRVCDLPGISFDIDTPEDLRDLMNYDSDAETLSFLHARGLPARLLARVAAQTAW